LRQTCRASCVVAIVIALASCSSSEDSRPGRNGPDYVAQLNAEYSRWQKAVAGGTEPAQTLWECALCPKISLAPAHTVWTGTPDWEWGREDNEPPLAEVNIPQPFGIGQYEVTRGQFAAFARATGRAAAGSCVTDRRERGVWTGDTGANYLDVGYEQADDHPVACVSFDDARDYVAWLNTQTAGGYRLPAEAEWEYFARANAHLLFAWSDEAAEACHYANVLDQTGGRALKRKDVVGCDDGAVTTMPVGSRLPSTSLAYDMIGNVAEWVDGCANQAPATESCTTGIAKGGSWASAGRRLRPSARSLLAPRHRENVLGFRVAKTLGELDAPLDSANAYLRRGRVLSFLRDADRALSDLGRAVELDRSAATLAARGWEHFRARRTDLARADFEAAVRLDAKNAPAISGLGSLLLDVRDPKAAIQKFDHALVLAPDFVLALGARAWAHAELGQFEQALEDVESTLRLAPAYPEIFDLRVDILRRRADWPRMLDAVDRLVLALPTLPFYQSTAARYYAFALQDADALRAADRAVRLNDGMVSNHLTRAEVRRQANTDGRKDVEAALKIDPDSPDALIMRAEFESHAGEHHQAAETLTLALNGDRAPEYRSHLLMLRAVAYLHEGDQKLAAQDFNESLGDSPGASALNNSCWELGLANVGLERALSYCNRAVALKPDSPAYLDSKGLVLLRMNRLEEAIRAYDTALRIAPELSASLYGRALAAQARCNCAANGADIKKALQLDPLLARRFERAGLAMRHMPKVKPPERNPGSSAS